ncbi:hypothetical protein N7468_009892 [Penicillium chermesinum]|uniref:Uncharacterized protein n=1 Tax=Penicillium chermesinum TaxID=63820 RepID=A0A9W9NBQ4_9EURO|nr:uncharacterized protein N7468_009892 [Penicillium chermesinum]KAJ5216884.1 hypothetical protein N7468_009892 [Penicillium chermesinum]KAJ6171503.1 hypothetical protein N7470_000570 [Penicillium chermesinum]
MISLPLDAGGSPSITLDDVPTSSSWVAIAMVEAVSLSFEERVWSVGAGTLANKVGGLDKLVFVSSTGTALFDAAAGLAMATKPVPLPTEYKFSSLVLIGLKTATPGIDDGSARLELLIVLAMVDANVKPGLLPAGIWEE